MKKIHIVTIAILLVTIISVVSIFWLNKSDQKNNNSKDNNLATPTSPKTYSINEKVKATLWNSRVNDKPRGSSSWEIVVENVLIEKIEYTNGYTPINPNSVYLVIKIKATNLDDHSESVLQIHENFELIDKSGKVYKALSSVHFGDFREVNNLESGLEFIPSNSSINTAVFFEVEEETVPSLLKIVKNQIQVDLN